MDENSTKNESIMIENSLTDEHLAVNDQQQENSIPCQPYPTRSIKVIKQAKKKPMNPTPLYIFSLFYFDYNITNVLQ